MELKDQYSSLRHKYEDFTDKLHFLIQELLSTKDIKCQNIEFRTKTVESFLEKVDRDGKNYIDPINEITDLSGLRIILYYLDDVEKVENLIKSEFKVDSKLSINKKEILDYDQFGYLSIHQIIVLKSPRVDLPEWKKFNGLIAEIQTRTVLQHAWASLSHTMEYKNEKDIPKELRRQLHRLAGLFELSDEEFLKIKEKKERITNSIDSSIATSKLRIPLNLDSLQKYIQSSSIVQEIARKAYRNGFERTASQDTTQYSLLVKVCNELKLESIEQLNNKLIELEGTSANVFKEFNRGDYNPTASPGHIITLLLLIENRKLFGKEKISNLVNWSPNYIERIMR